MQLQDLVVKEDVFDLMYEPLAGSNLTNLLRLWAQNRFYIAPRYLPRLLYALTLSTVLSPFRVAESVKFGPRIRETELSHHPVFIIGHWRSGTTYLHNVLSQDPQFGYCTTFHSVLPGAFMVGEHSLKSIVAASIPDKRPMDDVAMGPDLPQEEEYAMGAFTPWAYYNGWCFPRGMRFYNRCVTMENLPGAAAAEWQSSYHYLLKKLTLLWKGRQLVLKNPANTARLSLLLDMYPEAKFIHICRNPYHVFFSMMKFMVRVLPRYCVQRPPSTDTMAAMVLDVYHSLYRAYFEQKDAIPEGNLVEIRYEEFLQRPLAEMERIYSTLGLAGFPEQRATFQRYIDAQGSIRTSSYDLDEATKQRIHDRWQFAFDAFGYPQ
ncbi:MAG TPA: sulfotransferase [Thermoplasmatales archaeon]|nr:sulfotransferase [Thermoplasmatales archaeon]